MTPVCPVQCSFNLRQSQLALYVLAFVVDYPYTGWFRRTALYDEYFSWKKTQEKGLSWRQRLDVLSDDRFYDQLDRLNLRRCYQGRWVCYYIPPEAPEALHLSFSKDQGSQRFVFHINQRSRALTTGVAVETALNPEPARTIEVAAVQQDSPPPEGTTQSAAHPSSATVQAPVQHPVLPPTAATQSPVPTALQVALSHCQSTRALCLN